MQIRKQMKIQAGTSDQIDFSKMAFKNVDLFPPLCLRLGTHQEGEGGSSQDSCLKVGSAYVIVYSVTDRSSFDSASELRITLRRARQAENLPIILVGNKSDLVRSREVAVEGRGQRSRGVYTYTYGYTIY